MPDYYRLGNPAVSAISVDAVEHHVNEDGLLEVHEVTPNLLAALAHHAAERVNPEVEQQKSEAAAGEEAERQALFAALDEATGRRVDRRRSLQQLRQMRQDLEERQATAAQQKQEPEGHA